MLLSSKTSISYFLQNILTRCHRRLKFNISKTGWIISHTCLFLYFPIRQDTYSSSTLTSSTSFPDGFLVLPLKSFLHFALCTPLTWFRTLIMKNNEQTISSRLQPGILASNFICLLPCGITHVTPVLSTLRYLRFPDKTQTPYHDPPTSPASATDISYEFSYRPFIKELHVDPRVSTHLLPLWTLSLTS